MESRSTNPTIILTGVLVLGLIALWIVLGGLELSIDQQAKTFDILTKIATITAIAVGAFWTFILYVQQRTDHPSVDVEQEVITLQLPDQRFLLKVIATLTNRSKVQAPIVVWRIYASQILPVLPHLENYFQTTTAFPERRAEWLPIAGELDGIFRGEDVDLSLEPGQTETQIANLVVPASCQVVQVYSLFQHTDDDHPRGYPARTIVDLRLKKEEA